MISNEITNELKQLAENVCMENDLQHVYFTYRYGKRKHYLTGYGEISFGKLYHLDVNETVTMFWEGKMEVEKALMYLESIKV